MIKVLVELNSGHNYCLKVGTFRTDGSSNANDCIEWSAVLNELVKHVEHQAIARHTHVFEVFDNDFDDYYVIPSDGHMIDHLSRIRVRDKPIGNQLIDQSVCVTADDDNGLDGNRFVKNRINQIDNNNRNHTDSLDVDVHVVNDELILTKSIIGNTNSVETPVVPQELATKAPAMTVTTLPTKLVQKVAPNVCQTTANNCPDITTTATTSSITSDNTSAVRHSDGQSLVNNRLGLTPDKVRSNFSNIVSNASYFVNKNDCKLMTSTSSSTGGQPSVLNTSQMAANAINTEDILMPLPSGAQPSNPINYLDVELNNSDQFSTSASSKYLAYITFVRNVRDERVVCVRYEPDHYRAVVELVTVLKTVITDCMAGDYQDQVVRHMADNGFTDWDYDKCLKYFYNAFYLYKKILHNCPNTDTASLVNPLFDTIHAFVPHFLMTAKDFTKLNQLRQTFDHKCGDNKTISQQSNAGTSLTVQTDDTLTPKVPLSTTSIVPVGLRGNSEQNPIDYLCLTINGAYLGNACSQHLYYKSVVVKVGPLWLRGLAFVGAYQLTVTSLLYALDKCRPIDGKLVMDVDDWFVVINHMPRMRYNDDLCDVNLTPKRLRKILHNAIDLYKKTLASCPDMETAGIINPLFYALHLFDPQCIVSADECQEIRRLRQLFADKCSKDSSALTHPASLPLSSSASTSSLVVSDTNNELHELNIKSSKITKQDIQAFKSLCKCVNRTVNELGSYQDNSDKFWSNVSRLMNESGYSTWDPFTCKFILTDNVTKYYKIALKYLPSYSDAIKMYPYFAILHEMDLSQSLSSKLYDRIKPYLSAKKVGPKHLDTFIESSNITTTIATTSGSTRTIVASTLFSQTGQSTCSPKKWLKPGGELESLYQKSTQLTAQDLQRFQTLCKCVGRTVEELGPFRYNEQTFWPYVARLMRESDYGLSDDHKCRDWFQDHVSNHYKNALKYLTRYSDAVKVYPFFAAIHDMNLSQTLSPWSYDKIKPYRDAFKLL